jgi:hypothetical protein
VGVAWVGDGVGGGVVDVIARGGVSMSMCRVWRSMVHGNCPGRIPYCNVGSCPLTGCRISSVGWGAVPFPCHGMGALRPCCSDPSRHNKGGRVEVPLYGAMWGRH